jgi:cob(I)alamin adenosyltransferase
MLTAECFFMANGLIHIYTGDGKGKTTAAMGLAIRASGQNKNVLILQFLKSRVKDAGVQLIARKANIKVVKFKGQTAPLFDHTVKLSDLKKSVKNAIARVIREFRSNTYDLVILDEFNTVLGNGYASLKDAERLIHAKPDRVELVLTGRDAPKELIQVADYVTEMKMIKHPYEKGVQARKGIEY